MFAQHIVLTLKTLLKKKSLSILTIKYKTENYKHATQLSYRTWSLHASTRR